MGETVRDRFKAAFIPNSKLRPKMRQRHAATVRNMEAARSLAETLPDGERDAALKRLDDLDDRVGAAALEGVLNPGKGWAQMGPLEQEAAKLRSEWLGRDPKADRADPAKRFTRALGPTFSALQEARGGTRNIVDANAAGQLQRRVEALSDNAKALFNTVKTGGAAPTQMQCETMEAYRETAGELVRDVRRAAGLPATPGTERATSRAAVDTVMTAVPAIKARLEDPTPDAQGRTPMQDLRGRLEVFDDHFAADPDASPEAAKQNKAMRVAAIAAVTARRIAASVNDPNLEPRLAQSLIAEYASDLSGALGDDGEDEDDKSAIDLAQALVMDDPVTKLMTGKINPVDAVQRVRDMAEAGGVEPSAMLKLLRQQFEMKIGSINATEVTRGKKKPDAGAQGNFDLDQLPGELSMDQYRGMVETTETPSDLTSTFQDTDAAKWKDDGSGLALKPGGNEVHVVKAGDTLATLAAAYLGDAGRWQKIRNMNKVVVAPDQSHVAVKDLGENAPLPVGATLTVPSNKSLLDQLEPYVQAWDGADDDEEDEDESESETEPEEDTKLSNREKRHLRKAEAKRFKDNPRSEVTPEALAEAAGKLRSPAATDPDYIPAPGIGQSHQVREPLGADDVSEGLSRRDLRKLTKQQKTDMRQEHIDDETDALYGALSGRQYAHLRMLARADDEEEEELLAREGKPLDDVIADKISQRYGRDRVDDRRAREIARQIEGWVATVPLTITFGADKLFSDPTKNEPKHGAKYASEVTFSRGEEDLKGLIGRDDAHGGKGKVGTTGGTKTGWEERGENYMRWRRDKDDREGRHDELAYEDQQIFGAVNPAFGKAKGGVGKDYGSNFYGDAHFLLNSAVRNRCAFIVRAVTGSDSDTRPAVQRKKIGMLIYDMLTTSTANAQFVDAMLQNASASAKAIAPALNWEVHLYGGFDIRKDVDAIYLPDDLDKAVRKRVRAFAKANGLVCKKIGAKPDGLEVLPEMDPRQVELPAEADDESEDDGDET